MPEDRPRPTDMCILGVDWDMYEHMLQVPLPGPRGVILYSSVLDRSISARHWALYGAWGFDLERWQELMWEPQILRAKISQIARD
jgi:hypothetical protein